MDSHPMARSRKMQKRQPYQYPLQHHSRLIVGKHLDSFPHFPIFSPSLSVELPSNTASSQGSPTLRGGRPHPAGRDRLGRRQPVLALQLTWRKGWWVVASAASQKKKHTHIYICICICMYNIYIYT